VARHILQACPVWIYTQSNITNIIFTWVHNTNTEKIYNNCDYFVYLTVFILTHPVNFPCGRKPEHPEKTHDFRQSVDRLFSHESVVRSEPTNSEVKALALTTAPTKRKRLFRWPQSDKT
jgi:hypothetical protein